MNKLKIFDYENINKYNKIFFIDSDIIIHTNLNNIFDNLTKDNLLYVKKESLKSLREDHKNIFFSLQLYTEEQLDNFEKEKIFVFNAGQFGFFNSEQMKNHFNNINNLIINHKGEFFYEQSFMNHYFNLNKLKNDDILENKVRLFPEDNIKYENKLVHFCGIGEGNPKYDRMLNYFNKFLLLSN
jgi:lipopolysaccharide biosynthesis glycosyltransferase